MKSKLVPDEYDASDPDQRRDCARCSKCKHDLHGALSAEIPKSEGYGDGDESQHQASAPRHKKRAGRKIDDDLEHEGVAGCAEGAAQNQTPDRCLDSDHQANSEREDREEKYREFGNEEQSLTPLDDHDVVVGC